MWKIINEILHRKKRSDNIEKIKNNGVEITDKKEIAEILSEYYKFAAVNKINKIESKNSFEGKGSSKNHN